ncbi:putative Zn-dependent protease [Aminobacter lissarensis]|uniref:Zn-dependent protease n=1 Tax=Aminobacter carboxidus TaxID=376165 RepID=A0A8E1WFL3_9HYPH|nr:M48 family metalloprotease [Aminobacter lissarensis]MBB6466646.1 putative Zn-dependent protease [Aminobacter lissarensis]
MQSITSLSRFIARSTRAVTALALSAGLALGSTGAAHAQNVPIVRDAEIEALVRDYARPILKAAGLANSNINIILVNDPAFNAFVAGRRMFINTGALMTAETPNEIIGVIAHEAGHIAGGHQERLRDQLARAQTMAIVAALLGAGAMVAGAATDTSGLGAAGAGVVAGGSEMARRSLLGYQRSEETTADRSAMTYLNATGQSAQGMLKTFQRFQTALSLSGARVDPYQVSHPMPRDRIANLETLARESPFFDKKDSEALQQRHDMMRVKIAAYTQGQAAASRLLRSTDGLASRYGDAQSTYLFGDLRSALTKTDALIKSQPKNAYFHELRGDILMKSNKPAAAAEAYTTAVRLDTAKSGILPIALGQTYLAVGTPDALKKAVVEIRKGLDRDRENASGYRYLAQAYGMLGDVADADLATADGHYYSGAYQDAKIFAMRAQQKLQRGSPGWVRAQDIINYKAPSKKKK